MHEHAEQQISDQERTEAMIIAADPATQGERIREIEAYGREVLPRLGARSKAIAAR